MATAMINDPPFDEKSAFLQALGLPEEQRDTILKEICPNEDARRRIQTLLRHHGQVDDRQFLTPTQPIEKVPRRKHDRFAEFRVLDRLGEGGMGIVYLAEDTILGRQVAVKVLANHLVDSKQAVARFREEARNAAALKHPAIVPVHRFDRSGDDFYIVSEYVEGRTLTEVIIEQRKALVGGSAGDLKAWYRRSAEIVATIADALECAHRAHIVHRDVKPSNILLDEERGPRLTDFGVAKNLVAADATLSSMLVGTCHYMSPEQAGIAGSRVDQRSDIFSLGIVLYEMLGLRLPFEGTTAQQVISAVMDCNPPRLRLVNRHVPADLETICHKALEKEPEDRYQTAAHVAADLQCFLVGDPILARPPSLARRARRYVKRHQAVFVTLLVAVLVVGSGAVASMQYDSYLRTLGAVRFELPEASTAAVVTARPYDSTSQSYSAGAVLERGTGDRISIRAGIYRFRITDEQSHNFTEFDDFVGAGESNTYQLRLPPAQVAAGDMVRFEPGTYTIWDAVGHDVPEPRQVESDGFYLDATEVSNGDYGLFLDETGREPPPDWDRVTQADWDRLPVVGLHYSDMLAYAIWNGKRLPTYTEWSIAYCAPDGRRRPWGDAPAPDAIRPSLDVYCTSQQFGVPDVLASYDAHVLPVDSVPEAATPLGLFHMFGNVREVTGTMRVPGEGPSTSAGAIVAVAGGDWAHDPDCYEPFRRPWNRLSTRSPYQGFRCARSLESPTTDQQEDVK